VSIEAAFGPWVDGRDPVERKAQFRALAGICACFAGSGHRVVASLRAAEHDDGAAETARAEFEAMPALTRRRILSVFAKIGI
jgi:hypothetical protein